MGEELVTKPLLENVTDLEDSEPCDIPLPQTAISSRQQFQQIQSNGNQEDDSSAVFPMVLTVGASDHLAAQPVTGVPALPPYQLRFRKPAGAESEVILTAKGLTVKPRVTPLFNDVAKGVCIGAVIGLFIGFNLVSADPSSVHPTSKSTLSAIVGVFTVLLVMGLGSAVVVAVVLLFRAFRHSVTEVTLTPSYWYLARRRSSNASPRFCAGRTVDMPRARSYCKTTTYRVNCIPVARSSVYKFIVTSGNSEIYAGEGLKEEETLWIVNEINSYLAYVKLGAALPYMVAAQAAPPQPAP